MILSPCHNCVVASTRPIRETCWVVREGSVGWLWKLYNESDGVNDVVSSFAVPFEFVNNSLVIGGEVEDVVMILAAQFRKPESRLWATTFSEALTQLGIDVTSLI